MPIQVTMAARTTVTADEAFARLADYESYARYTDAVHSVEVFEDDAGPCSRWSVEFRGGVLRWTERDVHDPVGRVLTFEQVDGDLARFDGTWRVLSHEGGSEVRFDSVLDLGMPSLAPIVDPVAEAALRENMTKILRGLFGADLAVGGR